MGKWIPSIPKNSPKPFTNNKQDKNQFIIIIINYLVAKEVLQCYKTLVLLLRLDKQLVRDIYPGGYEVFNNFFCFHCCVHWYIKLLIMINFWFKPLFRLFSN